MPVTFKMPLISDALAMSNRTIEDVGDPVRDQDATNKRWVEAQIPKGLWRLMAYVKGSPNSHAVEYKTTFTTRLQPRYALLFNH